MVLIKDASTRKIRPPKGAYLDICRSFHVVITEEQLLGQAAYLLQQ